MVDIGLPHGRKYDGGTFYGGDVFKPSRPWPMTWLNRAGVLQVRPPKTQLRTSLAGRNARGVCLHRRVKLAKQAKGQRVGGYRPGMLRASQIDLSRIPGNKQEL